MSSEYKLDYFPPKGTKYVWDSPVLQNRPWMTDMKGICWPQYCVCAVDRNKNGYYGYLRFTPLNYEKTGVHLEKRTRFFKDPLKALLAIEKIADRLLAKDTKPWMKEAVKAGWRP
jgi:hypothetical protein